MEEQVVYKVALDTPDGFISCMGDHLPEKWVVSYEVGTWSTPRMNGSLLFAFDRLSEAVGWARGFGAASYKVFKAAGVGVKPAPLVAYGWWNANILAAFWRRSGIVSTMPVYRAVTCEKIMLLEEIGLEQAEGR